MRGKTHVARELKRYIEFFHGARAEVFDINDYLGPAGNDELFSALAHFFVAGEADSEHLAELGDTKSRYSGGFAILVTSDTLKSTESLWSAHTKWHRRWMAKTLAAKLDAEVCFVQISVGQSERLQKYMEELARSRRKPIEECNELIDQYQDHYVPIQMDGTESDTPFIQLINYNETIVVNRMMQSFVGSRVCHFLTNIHPYKHTYYISRHGESLYNVEKKLGGDSSLSRRGEEYARRLAEFVRYVIVGKATNLVCVTLTPDEVKDLKPRLTGMSRSRPGGALGIFAKGIWSNYGDTSGGVIMEGMKLVRLQVGFGSDFIDAPDSMDEVLKCIGSRVATLVFVEGDTSCAGQVPGRLWTSSLRRTIETSAFIDKGFVTGADGKPWRQMSRRQFRSLDEVYAGEYDGLTEKEIQERDPQTIVDRKRDKLGFRYPRGESYFDIIARLDDVLTHLERVHEPTLLISHQAVLRMIHGWVADVPREKAVDFTFPQHAVIKVAFDGVNSGTGQREEIVFPLGPGQLIDDGQANL